MKTPLFVLGLSIAQAIALSAAGQTASNPCDGYKPADLRSPLPFLRLEQCRARCMPSGRPTPSDAELQACIDRAPEARVGSGTKADTSIAKSSFTADAEGWTGGSFPDNGPYDRVMARAPVRWTPGAGRSGGAISMTDPGAGNFFFEAPGAFFGDKRSDYGGQLRYDVRSEGGEQFDEADVILVSGGPILVFRAPTRPGTAWSSVVVPLVESAWMVDRPGGRAPSRDEFTLALGSLTALRIRGEYRNGPDTGWLANVSMVPAQNPQRSVTPGAGSVSDRTTQPAGRNGTSIAGIYVGHAADDSGRILRQSSPVLDRRAPKIYINVDVAGATRGTVVSVTLTYLGNNASIGPLSNPVTVGGNVMIAFSFTNSSKEWPVGNFRATVRLPDGTQQTKDFTIE